jgi:hypothetical protein
MNGVNYIIQYMDKKEGLSKNQSKNIITWDNEYCFYSLKLDDFENYTFEKHDNELSQRMVFFFIVPEKTADINTLLFYLDN